MSFPQAGRARKLTIALLLTLVGWVVLWRTVQSASGTGVLFAALMTVPLWLPLRGLLRGNRRTYAWATLCVIPYLVFGVTEAVANPVQRTWAAGCLALAFGLFITLIAYLRMTRASDDGVMG